MTDTNTITLPRSWAEQALEALNASMTHNNDMDEDWPSHIAARHALRAALTQPQGEVVVTTNQQGHCVAVTRQDEEGRILSVVWESKQPQVEPDPVAYATHDTEGSPSMLFFDRREAENYCDDHEEPTPLYTHSQNLNCKSTQARLATLWGYEKPQPKRQPLTNEQVKVGLIDSIDFADQRERCAFNLGVRFAERAHGIGGEA